MGQHKRNQIAILSKEGKLITKVDNQVNHDNSHNKKKVAKLLAFSMANTSYTDLLHKSMDMNDENE